MREVLSRSYSNVYFHFIPRYGDKHLGRPQTVMRQMQRLNIKVRELSNYVQDLRINSGVRLNERSLISLIDYAFRQLTQCPDEPFDYQIFKPPKFIPGSIELHILELMGTCLKRKVNEDPEVGDRERWNGVASFLASTILGNCLRTGAQNSRKFTLHTDLRHKRPATNGRNLDNN